MSLIFAFILALKGLLTSGDFTFIAIAVAGGQHAVNGIERKASQ